MGTSNTGTNGKKSIEEILKKDRVIRKLLDEDEAKLISSKIELKLTVRK